MAGLNRRKAVLILRRVFLHAFSVNHFSLVIISFMHYQYNTSCLISSAIIQCHLTRCDKLSRLKWMHFTKALDSLQIKLFLLNRLKKLIKEKSARSLLDNISQSIVHTQESNKSIHACCFTLLILSNINRKYNIKCKQGLRSLSGYNIKMYNIKIMCSFKL